MSQIWTFEAPGLVYFVHEAFNKVICHKISTEFQSFMLIDLILYFSSLLYIKSYPDETLLWVEMYIVWP